MPYADPAIAKVKRHEHYLRNRERIAEYNRAYYATNSEECKERVRRHYVANRDDCLERAKAYSRAHPERWRNDRVRKRNQDWFKAHPEVGRSAVAAYRARRKASPSVERITRHEIYERDGGMCRLCGTVLAETASTMDHIIPLSRGGEHTRANIQLACRSCNSRKRDKLMSELDWLAEATP